MLLMVFTACLNADPMEWTILHPCCMILTHGLSVRACAELIAACLASLMLSFAMVVRSSSAWVMLYQDIVPHSCLISEGQHACVEVLRLPVDVCPFFFLLFFGEQVVGVIVGGGVVSMMVGLLAGVSIL